MNRFLASCCAVCQLGLLGLLSLTPALALAEELRIGGTGAALGTMRLLAEAYAKQQPDVSLKVLPSLGSGGGIKAVLAGAIQLAVSARPANESETKAGAVTIEYGRTPFIFATPSSNKATGLSTKNLVDIYAGRQETWPDGSRIRLVMRPLGDSDTETIKSMSPAMREAKTAAEKRKGMLFSVSDQDTADTLEKTPGSVGPTTLALVLSEKRALKALALDGVVPDRKSVADGRYRLVKELYLVTGPKSPASAKGFLAFVRSAAGREILELNGYWVP